MLMGVDLVSSGAIGVVVEDISASSVWDGDAEAVLLALSLLCQFIWIIGAKRLKVVVFASTLGTVWEGKTSTFEPSHIANDSGIDVATVKHVCPPMLAHA